MLTADLNLSRRMGAEFEMTVPRIGSGTGTHVQQSIADCLTANGIRAIARTYQHSPVPDGYDVAVESDSSVRGESRFQGVSWNPVEVKTRILNGVADWEAIVPRTLEICRYLGARVNRSCGHHLHVDFPEARVKPTKIRSLYNLMHRFEPVIFGLNAPSRRSNGYAKAMDDRARLLHGCRSLSCFRRALAGWQRQSGLNLTHLFGTEPRIEFRYHGGTLDAEKARHWMRLMNRLVEHSVTRSCQAARQQVANDRKGIEAFRYTVGLRSNAGIYAKVAPELRETSKFMLGRWKHLNPNNSSEG